MVKETNKKASNLNLFIILGISLLLILSLVSAGMLIENKQISNLGKISELYSDIEQGKLNVDNLVFLDEQGNKIEVESIRKKQYKNKIYDVDVENDIVLVERDGLIVWSGNSNNGTAVDNAHQVDAGYLGKGFEFDGTNDYVEFGDNSLVEGLSEMTVSAWAKLEHSLGTSPQSLIVGKFDTIRLYWAGSEKMSFQVWNESDVASAADANLDLADHDWHHYVGVYNGTNVLLYIDNVLQDDQSVLGGVTQDDTDNFRFGSFWNGTIDDVLIFNRTLSAAEIRGLYANKSSEYLERNFTGLSEAAHTFKAYTQDLAGNLNETALRTVDVDVTYPDINLTFPLNTTYTSIITRLNYTASDTNLNTCWYSLDGGTTNTTLTCGENATGLNSGQGSKTWWVWANDSANNVNSSNVTFFVDSIYPDINITFPINNTNSSNNQLNINYTYSDVNVNTCWYSNDTYSANTTLSSCGTNITDVTWVDGEHNVTIWINDTANNVNSSMIFFTIDTTYPTISITAPSNNSNLSSATFDLNYTFTETNPGFCWYSNNSGTVNSSSVSMGTNWTAITGVEGSNNRTIYCNDSANNINSTIVHFTIDTINPNINITFPSNNTNSSDNQLNINYTVSDSGVGLSSCWYSNDTMSANTTLANCVNITTVTWVEGEHNVTIWVNDSVNNLNSSAVTFTVDSIAPNVNITYPLNTIYSSSSIDFNVTLNEAGYCEYTLNSGVANYTMTANSSNTGFNATNSSVADGSYTVLAYCNDSVGNANYTENVTFTISTDSGAPTITLIAPADATSATTAAYNFTFNVSDDSDVDNCSLIFDGSVIHVISSVSKDVTVGMYNSSLSVASHTWSVNCTDALNNVGNSSSRTLTVSAATTPAAPSGGGGGAVPSALRQDFDLDINSLVIRGVVGDLKTREIKIKNTGKVLDKIKISVEGEGFDKIIILDKDYLELESGGSEVVGLKVVVPEELGVYTGGIVFETRDAKKKVLVVVNTQSEETLFDISVGIPEAFIKKGDLLGAQVNLIPVGEKGVDVTLKYLIKDFKGKIYYEGSETFYVDEQVSFTKEFETNNLAGNDYVLGVEMTYSGGFATASAQFEIEKYKFPYEFKWDMRYLVVIIIVMILILIAWDILEIKRIRKGKRYKKVRR